MTDATPAIDPRRTALLVMDYQNAIIGRAFHSDSPATAVHDQVAPEPGDIIARKARVGAFSTTDLDALLS